MMYTTILSIAIILFESISSKIFLRGVLTEKHIFKNPFLNFCTVLFFIALPGFIISILIDNVLVKSIAIILLYFSVIKIFYQCKKILTGLSLAVILYATIIALDYFVILVCMSIFLTSSNKFSNDRFIFLFAVMISKLLLFMSVVIYSRFINNNNDVQHINKMDWGILMMQSIVSILSFVAIIELSAYSTRIPAVVFLGSVGLLFSSLFVFYFLESAAKYETDIREKSIIQKQLETEMESLVSLKNSYDSQRRIMHDCKNHMSTIYNMLINNHFEETLCYINELTGEIYHSLYRIKTNNDLIDVILNQKDQLAQQKGIILDIRSGDLSSLNLPAKELVTIISNVLDNSIEACEKVQVKKIITGKLVIENDMFIFSVLNPVNERVKIINNRIKTTKDNPTIHGFGLQNIAHSLKRCNGDFEIGCDGKTFQFTALIKIG